MTIPETLTAALPFMLKYQGQTVVIKYGGNAMTDDAIKKSVLSDILLLKTLGRLETKACGKIIRA